MHLEEHCKIEAINIVDFAALGNLGNVGDIDYYIWFI